MIHRTVCYFLIEYKTFTTENTRQSSQREVIFTSQSTSTISSLCFSTTIRTQKEEKGSRL